MKYPQTKTVDHVDMLHGQAVPDPYRWLEALEGPETRAWIEAQNQLTSAYLAQIPARTQIQARLEALWDYDQYGLPVQRGGRCFYTCKQGLQNQPALYWQDGLAGEPRPLLDPNTLSQDGTVAMTGFFPSPDGNLVAYSLSSGGSDWQTWRIREVDRGEDLPEVLEWSKFCGAAWTADSQGFFYSRYDPPAEGLKDANYYQKLYYHRLGTDQSADALVYERPDHKEWGFIARVTEDGRWLVLNVWQGTHRENGIFIKDLTDPAGGVVELWDAFDARYSFAGSLEDRLYFNTDLEAPLGRVIAVDIGSGDSTIQEVVPEAEEALAAANLVGGMLLCRYLKDAYTAVRRFGLDGSPFGEIQLPGIGAGEGFDGRLADKETFYTFEDFSSPAAVYRYDIENDRSEVFRQPELGFNPGDFQTRQVFYESKDGTRIPMFLSHRVDVVPSKDTPVLLHGYGGFDVAKTPAFSVMVLVWMEMGGVFASANLRGGGEYGKAWHDMGRLANKQNVFDDFIAAGEYLVREKYTNPNRLAITGRSNGGLLVGACMTQRPDLFAACLPGVGVMDMLRFHKFTIGWAWVSDYGDPDDPDDFAVLRAYSPYHNLQPGKAYPATLITTGDHDDRVFPAHSFKFAAALQAAGGRDGEGVPLLIRIETRAGHGAGKPTAKVIAEQADQLAFLVRELQIDWR